MESSGFNPQKQHSRRNMQIIRRWIVYVFPLNDFHIPNNHFYGFRLSRMCPHSSFFKHCAHKPNKRFRIYNMFERVLYWDMAKVLFVIVRLGESIQYTCTSVKVMWLKCKCSVVRVLFVWVDAFHTLNAYMHVSVCVTCNNPVLWCVTKYEAFSTHYFRCENSVLVTHISHKSHLLRPMHTNTCILSMCALLSLCHM